MKIILFGASLGGQNYLKNHSHEYEVLAVADNNAVIHGQLLEGNLIINPSAIPSYPYDKIIVASMYVDSITKQLVELGVPREKIAYASKISMKRVGLPFEDESILSKANQMIAKLSEILYDIPHYYAFGTLLGIVRDGRLIPWDDDIDVTIHEQDVEEIKQRLILHAKELKEIIDIKMYERVRQDGKVIALMIDCYINDEAVFNIGLDTIFIENNIAKHDLNETPAVFFKAYEEIEFNGVKLKVPNKYEDFLTYTYGDWRKVKKHTSFANNTLSFTEPKLSSTNYYFYEYK